MRVFGSSLPNNVRYTCQTLSKFKYSCVGIWGPHRMNELQPLLIYCLPFQYLQCKLGLQKKLQKYLPISRWRSIRSFVNTPARRLSGTVVFLNLTNSTCLCASYVVVEVKYYGWECFGVLCLTMSITTCQTASEELLAIRSHAHTQRRSNPVSHSTMQVCHRSFVSTRSLAFRHSC